MSAEYAAAVFRVELSVVVSLCGHANSQWNARNL